MPVIMLHLISFKLNIKPGISRSLVVESVCKFWNQSDMLTDIHIWKYQVRSFQIQDDITTLTEKALLLVARHRKNLSQKIKRLIRFSTKLHLYTFSSGSTRNTQHLSKWKHSIDCFEWSRKAFLPSYWALIMKNYRS